MANFEKAYAITMAHEGGYANHKDDKGGETYKGVARNFNPNWSGWQVVDVVKNTLLATGAALDVQSLNRMLGADKSLQANVRAFYKANYWDVNRLDEVINQDIAIELFDTGVNCGTDLAAKMLQESLNVLNVAEKQYPNIDQDGIVGPTTLRLLNNHPKPSAVLKVLNGLQFERYMNIIRKNQSQEVFLTSWLSRVAML